MLLVLAQGKRKEGTAAGALAQHKQNTEEQSFVPRETGESVRYNMHSQHRIKPFFPGDTLLRIDLAANNQHSALLSNPSPRTKEWAIEGHKSWDTEVLCPPVPKLKLY